MSLSRRPGDATPWGVEVDGAMVVTGAAARSVAARSEAFREGIAMVLCRVNHVAVRTPEEVRAAAEGSEWGMDSFELRLRPASPARPSTSARPAAAYPRLGVLDQ